MVKTVETTVAKMQRGDHVVSGLPLGDCQIVEFVTAEPTCFFDNTPPAIGNVAIFLTSLAAGRDRVDSLPDAAVIVERWSWR